MARASRRIKINDDPDQPRLTLKAARKLTRNKAITTAI